MVVFCSNDYLGLSQRELLKEAPRAYGWGAGSSRLMAGTTAVHRNLERELASFLRTESALVFSSGSAANAGLLTAVTDPGTLVLSDELNHASVVDACRLSKARVRVYPHGDAAAAAAFYVIAHAIGKSALFLTAGVLTVLGTVLVALVYVGNPDGRISNVGWRMAGAVVIGLVLAQVASRITEYFTSTETTPVREIAESTQTGPATTILSGFSVGMESTVWAILIIAGVIWGAFVLGDGAAEALYFISLTGMGMLTTVGVIVSMDTYGPVSDNAQGIAEMSGEFSGRPAQVLTGLDAVGNSTKAITKGMAIATAVIAATSLFGSFREILIEETGRGLVAIEIVAAAGHDGIGAQHDAVRVSAAHGLHFRQRQPARMGRRQLAAQRCLVDICGVDGARLQPDLAQQALDRPLAPPATGHEPAQRWAHGDTHHQGGPLEWGAEGPAEQGDLPDPIGVRDRAPQHGEPTEGRADGGHLVELLARPPLNFAAGRYTDEVWPAPRWGAHFGPKALVVSHVTLSAGENFAYYFRKLGLGPIVGARTWGGLTGLNPVPGLVDGGAVNVPNAPFFDRGEWLIEGHGLEPDRAVEWDPARLDDPQLAEAVKAMLDAIATPRERPRKPQ